MSGSRSLWLVVASVMAIACPVCINSQAGSRERSAVVEIAKRLQESPLDQELQDEGSSWEETYLGDTNAYACDEQAPWGAWANSDYKYSVELMAIYTLSNAAFVISHPDQNDPKAAHMTGLEGSMKAYQAIIAQDPTARWKEMEQLISRRGRGKLQTELASFCATPVPLKAFAAVTLAGARKRFGSGWLEGFTMSPTEHIVNELDNPFTVRAVKGSVVDPSGAGMSGVLVEIRDAKGRIRATKTGSKGTFMLGDVPSGSYKFKMTRDGFKSVVGEIVVSKRAHKAEQIKIVMQVGA